MPAAQGGRGSATAGRNKATGGQPLTVEQSIALTGQPGRQPRMVTKGNRGIALILFTWSDRRRAMTHGVMAVKLGVMVTS
jgi:hypothetical protein